MISGKVNVYREAVIRLLLQNPLGRGREIEAVVDTGFNGYLTLPPDLVSGLALPFRRSGRALLGDGSEITFDIHETVILWDGQLRRIAVDVANTDPLLGMGLLYGHQLNLQVIEDGDVFIRPLPVS